MGEPRIRALRGRDVPPDTLAACAELFSSHYGVWAACDGAKPRRVRLSPGRLAAEYMFDDTCRLYTADVSGTLVGYAAACHFQLQGRGRVDWITQLVVHAAHRGRGIATRLCEACCEPDTAFACGLVSSHPFAVLALQAACRRPCDPARAAEHFAAMAAGSGIPYVRARPFAPPTAVDTAFDVDHSEIEGPLREAARTAGWTLGPALAPGHEFVAFAFRD